MSKGNETVTIRVSTKTKAVLDYIAAERRLATGKYHTHDQAIMYAIEQGLPHTIERMLELREAEEDKGSSSKR